MHNAAPREQRNAMTTIPPIHSDRGQHVDMHNADDSEIKTLLQHIYIFLTAKDWAVCRGAQFQCL